MTMLLSIITPTFGLFFWTAVIFLIFFVLLRRFAWKPIMNAIHAREAKIEDSLAQAEQARKDMERLNADNEALLKEARAERDAMLKDAASMKEQIIADARKEAQGVAAAEREKAKAQIEAEKSTALNEIRETAATLAVEIAEKLLRKQFADQAAQEAYAKTLISDLNKN